MESWFSVESPFFQWLSKLADRILINILFVVSALPVITAGAAATALYYTTARLERDEGHIWQDYWKAFRTNFKQATILWMILLVGGLLIGFSVLYYLKVDNPGGTIGFWLVAVLFFVWAATCSWVFPLQSRFENPSVNTLKNALIFGLLYFIKSIVVAAVNFLPVVCFIFFPTAFIYLAFVWLLLWFSTAASINLYIFKKQFAELEKMSLGE